MNYGIDVTDVVVAGEESINPSKSVPTAILGCLVICTIAYISKHVVVDYLLYPLFFFHIWDNSSHVWLSQTCILGRSTRIMPVCYKGFKVRS